MAIRPAPPDTNIQLPSPQANYLQRLHPLSATPPRIAAQKPDDLRGWFDNVFYHLESRASGHYANQTYDTLTLVEKFTVDNRYAADRGLDKAQNLWNEQYGKRVRRLHWTFHSLKNFIEFGADYFHEYPDASVTIKLSLPDDLPSDQRQRHHDRCRKAKRSQGYHCCELCALWIALQKSSSRIAIDDVLNAILPPGRSHLAVMYSDSRIEFMDAWELVDGELRTMALEVSGTLGAVFATTHWEDFTIV